MHCEAGAPSWPSARDNTWPKLLLSGCLIGPDALGQHIKHERPVSAAPRFQHCPSKDNADPYGSSCAMTQSGQAASVPLL